LKPGSARQVDLGLEPGRVEEKTGEEKTRCDPADPARPVKTRLQTRCLLFFLFFLLKRRRFDF
jgi:hypothetical protein